MFAELNRMAFFPKVIFGVYVIIGLYAVFAGLWVIVLAMAAAALSVVLQVRRIHAATPPQPD